MITIQEAKRRGIIPQKYWNSIQDKCDPNPEIGGCGSDILTTDTLSLQTCSNPRCRLKLVGRAVKMLNNFGIIGISREYCKKFFLYNDYKSHLAILIAKEADYFRTGRHADSRKLLGELIHLKNQKYIFSQLVPMLALPEFDKNAEKVFTGFISLNMLEKYLEAKEISMYQYLTSIPGIGDKLAKHYMYLFDTFRLEFDTIVKIFKIQTQGILPKQNGVNYTIVITGHPDFYDMSKKEFINYLNRVGKGYITCTLSSGAVESCDYIISNSANDYLRNDMNEVILDEDGEPIIVMGTRKHEAGKRRNKLDKRKVLVTPREMIRILQNEVEMYEK